MKDRVMLAMVGLGLWYLIASLVVAQIKQGGFWWVFLVGFLPLALSVTWGAIRPSPR